MPSFHDLSLTQSSPNTNRTTQIKPKQKPSDRPQPFIKSKPLKNYIDFPKIKHPKHSKFQKPHFTLFLPFTKNQWPPYLSNSPPSTTSPPPLLSYAPPLLTYVPQPRNHSPSGPNPPPSFPKMISKNLPLTKQLSQSSQA